MNHLNSHITDLLSYETGSQKKKWKGRLPVALLFPNSYQLGMSNLGLQLVYSMVNNNPDIVCERVFYPITASQPLSVESGRPLRDFAVILCTVSFEQDFSNLVKMLQLGGVEAVAEKRGMVNLVSQSGAPLVIAGGVATFMNPEPLALFVDLFILGEAEPVLPMLMEYLVGCSGSVKREELLYDLVSKFDGCYAPRFYIMEYAAAGLLTAVSSDTGVPAKIKKVVADKPAIAHHSKLFTPDTEFSDMFLVELGRGCSRGCHFCAASFVYRPSRLWRSEAVVAALSARPPNIHRIGLLGMEMAHPDVLAEISEYLLAENCSLSFSSLRADAITPALIKLLQKSNLKSAAIAPDGGSQRLRRVINKGITEDDLLQAAELLVTAGVINLKLYFMVGLPTESRKDLEELVSLVFKIKKIVIAIGRSRGRVGNLILSINSFVPKPFTPFQFHPFAKLADLKNKLKFLRQKLANIPNVKLTMTRPEHGFFQAMLARGDRRVGAPLLAMSYVDKNWRQLYRDEGICPEDYAMRQRGENELFPWEIVDHGIDRCYLWREYQKALHSYQ